MKEDDITIWITYHNDNQIKEYNLIEDENHKLFKANDTNVDGYNINNLNQFYCEICTIYYVWKNQIKSDAVGFEHYRRKFRNSQQLLYNEVQVLEICKKNMFKHYKKHHNYQDYYDLVDIINEKYGDGNKYTNVMLNSNLFINRCCFIMKWEYFNKMCDFIFPILFEFDNRHHLNMNPENYLMKTKKDFRYDDINIQQRYMGYLAERLISCFIQTEMKFKENIRKIIENSPYNVIKLY